MKILQRQHSRGQAMVEYAVVVTMGALVLIWSSLGDPSPIQQLLDNLRSFYRAFSFAIAVAT
jgi:Flp pilus assembly pilin Flp